MGPARVRGLRVLGVPCQWALILCLGRALDADARRQGGGLLVTVILFISYERHVYIMSESSASFCSSLASIYLDLDVDATYSLTD